MKIIEALSVTHQKKYTDVMVLFCWKKLKTIQCSTSLFSFITFGTKRQHFKCCCNNKFFDS